VDLIDFARDAAAAITTTDTAIVVEPAKLDELKRRALIVAPDARMAVCEHLLAVAARVQRENPGLTGTAFDQLVDLAALVLGNGNRNADGFETTDPARVAEVLGTTSSPGAAPLVVDAPVLTPPRGRIRI
jgi:hypothetical protein